MLALSFSGFDPDVWSGRALQEDFVELAAAVLHQCIRPLIGASGVTMTLIGLAGFGFVAYRRRSKPALMAA
ncbi:hypothetical protein SAMN05443247_11874 [Bradyrhizobium erythrophlei]|nr:hypothetical protein SAMN05443247_11874 [Bradyrhizobium erythrophlei]